MLSLELAIETSKLKPHCLDHPKTRHIVWTIPPSPQSSFHFCCISVKFVPRWHACAHHTHSSSHLHILNSDTIMSVPRKRKAKDRAPTHARIHDIYSGLSTNSVSHTTIFTGPRTTKTIESKTLYGTSPHKRARMLLPRRLEEAQESELQQTSPAAPRRFVSRFPAIFERQKIDYVARNFCYNGQMEAFFPRTPALHHVARGGCWYSWSVRLRRTCLVPVLGVYSIPTTL